MEDQPPAAVLTAVLLMLLCSTAEMTGVRLMDGGDRCSGTPEVLYEGEWRMVDVRATNYRNVMVMCIELDCGNAVNVTIKGDFRDPNKKGIDIKCEGTESSVSQCRQKEVNLKHNLTVEVTCSVSVRLVDGAGFCSGRVEVMSQQSWTTVCDSDFDWKAAEVVCRELDCGTPLTLQGALFGEGKHPFGSKDFRCEGSEKRLLNCPTSAREENNCTGGSAVELTCSGPGDVRLVGGSRPCAGRVEMFHSGEWRRVTAVLTTVTSVAAVVCGQLDCGSAVVVKSEIKGPKSQIQVVVSCSGQESALRECSTLYISFGPIQEEVTCSDSVNLVDGAGRCSGRVEVKSQQSWTTVCDSDFDWKAAEVVCRELDCGTPLTLQGALFGEGKHPFGTKDFRCEGSEKRLLNCPTSDREENTCPGGSAVELTCSEQDVVRLVEGNSRCAGTVEVFFSGEWRRVEAYGWLMDTAQVVCRHLGCGSAVAATRRFPERNETEWSVDIYCSSSESELKACKIYNETLVQKAGVICSDFLEKPIFSFSTPIRVSSDLQGPEVFRGLSFSITCSTHPQYPGGTFHLRLPWTNRTYTQPAVNHSASFHFPAADDSHQGNYSCIYEKRETFHNREFKISQLHRPGFWFPEPFISNFSSESEPLSLTVRESPLPAVISRMLLVPLLLLITCSSIFLIFKYCGHFLIRRNTSNTQEDGVYWDVTVSPDQQGAATED